MSIDNISRYAAYGRADEDLEDSYWKLTVLCRLSKEDINTEKIDKSSRPNNIYPHITICQYIESKLPKTISRFQYEQVEDFIKEFKEDIKTVTLTLAPSETSKYQLVTVDKEIEKLRNQIANLLNTTHKSSIDESIKDGHITAKLSLTDHVLKSEKIVLDTSKFIVSVALSPLHSNVKLFNCIYERDGVKNKIANKIAKALVAITEKNYRDFIGNSLDAEEIVLRAFEDIKKLKTTENMNENDRKHNQDNEIQSSNKKQKL